MFRATLCFHDRYVYGLHIRATARQNGYDGNDASPNVILFQTLDLIRSKLYATGRIRQSVVNDIKLDALFSALLLCRRLSGAVCLTFLPWFPF